MSIYDDIGSFTAKKIQKGIVMYEITFCIQPEGVFVTPVMDVRKVWVGQKAVFWEIGFRNVILGIGLVSDIRPRNVSLSDENAFVLLWQVFKENKGDKKNKRGFMRISTSL